jgi:hypothetical protein
VARVKTHHARRSAPFLVIGLLLLGLVVGAGCHQAAILGVRPGVWNDRLVATLEATGETSGPFLALNNPEAGSAAQFKVGDVGGGAPSVVSAVQGNAPGQGTVFSLGALPNTFYLNLSIPVFGTIYVGSAGTQAPASVDAMEVRVIVRQGDRIIGGESVAHNVVAANKMGKWLTIPLAFRAEVSALEIGKPLSVEVQRVSGLTDFIIGTGGAAQSFVEFRYFKANPLAGTIYLEKGRFSSSGGEQVSEAEFGQRLEAFKASGGWEAAPQGYVHLPAPPEKSSAGALAFVAFGSLFAVGLVMPRRPLPLKPLAVLLIAFAILSAGCMGSGAKKIDPALGDDAQPTPTVSQTLEERPDLVLAGTGAVDGFVHDDVGIAIKGAHVAFLGTNLFGRTDARGLFAFDNVSAGVYVLRVDAEKFAPLEQEVTIETGSITHLNVTLVDPVVKQANDKAHVHDDWLGQTSAVFADDTFTPPSQVYTQAQNLGSTWYCDGVWDRDAGALTRSGCESKIPINMAGRKVFPGTSSVEVSLKWAAGGNAPKELGLRVVTSFNRTATQFLMPRAPGVPFHIAIFPNEADPGHMKFSTWEFFVDLPVTDAYYPAGPLYYSGGPISYSIKMHKGVVPYEPAHRDFWGGQTELQLEFVKNPVTAQAQACYPRKDTDYVWLLKSPSLIPPGTKEIHGFLKWTNANFDLVASAQTQWKLDFLGANAPNSDATFQKAEMSANGTSNYNFKITPKAEETDQFYQTTSNWLFSADSGGAPQASTYCGGTTNGTIWTLYAVAVKDPDYKDAS